MEKVTKENNLNESIVRIKVGLQKSKIKKSGKNKYAGFNYYELADFLPKLNELMLENGINDSFTIENDSAILCLMKNNEKLLYKIPFKLFETPVNKDGKPSMQDIQYLGALNTYYKRYLYLNAFGITDGEIIDSMNNDDIKNNPKESKTIKATDKQISIIKELCSDEEIDKTLEFYKIKNIEDLSIQYASAIISKKKGNN